MGKIELLENVSILNQDSFTDHRGQLYTIWKNTDIPNISFNHDKVAISKKNVLRGLHTDKSWKLISCLYGKIQLVIVNFDKKHKEYLYHMDLILNSNNNIKSSILIPPGFLNGHLVLSKEAIFHYKWAYDGNYPEINEQISVNWADPKIGIKWMVNNPILSERDKYSVIL